MKKFQKVIYTPFSSPNANLTITIEAQAQKKNQAGDLVSNAYLSSANNIFNNIPIYVVLEYKNELQQGSGRLYLSYPNMEDFKETIHYMRKNFQNAFGKVKNEMVVKPEFEEGILIEGIGQNNNWAQFKFVVCSTNENGIEKKIPCVGLSMSVSEGFMSILTEKEIKHLDYLFQNINLVELAWAAGISYIDCDENKPQQYQYKETVQQQYFRPTSSSGAPRTAQNNAISRINGNSRKKIEDYDEEETTQFLPPRSAMTRTTVQQTNEEKKQQNGIMNMKNIDEVSEENFDLNNDSDIEDIFI